VILSYKDTRTKKDAALGRKRRPSSTQDDLSIAETRDHLATNELPEVANEKRSNNGALIDLKGNAADLGAATPRCP